MLIVGKVRWMVGRIIMKIGEVRVISPAGIVRWCVRIVVRP